MATRGTAVLGILCGFISQSGSVGGLNVVYQDCTKKSLNSYQLFSHF